MATFKSSTWVGGVPFRPTRDGTFDITASVKIPAGRTLAANDVLKFMKLGANVEILTATLRCDKLEDASGTASTLDLGTYASSGTFDADGLLDGSTVTQAGGIVRVGNGGDDPFATAQAATTQTVDVQATFLGTATQSTADDADRYVTLSLTCAPKRSALLGSDPAYVYADRYTAAGVSST